MRRRRYADAGHCTWKPKPVVHNQFSSGWDEEEGLWRKASNVWLEVEWRGKTLDALILTWTTNFQEHRTIWIIADDQATAEEFFTEVSAWNAEVRDEVLVFDGGCWSKSDTLFQAIQTATFENLVLAGSLKQEILDDLAGFFARKQTYFEHYVPWKRGVLFVGPPATERRTR